VLPLPPKKRFAVIGPLGNATQDLLGNYYEWACPLSESDFSCIPSLFDSFQTQDVISVQYAQGCDLIDPSIQNISAAVELAAAADYVILAIGINNSVCGEGQDRSNIDLPGAQLNLTLALLAVGKPTVVLLFNGGQLAIEDIYGAPGPLAIVEVFYPGNQGGVPVVEQLFGFANRWGKLAYTMYYSNITAQLVLGDMSMTKAPGRTYKYFTGPAVFPFGYGLSYTSFSLTHTEQMRSMLIQEASFCDGISVTVTNTGDRSGDEVVLLFIRPQNGTVIPGANDTLAQKVLVGFERVTLASHQVRIASSGNCWCCESVALH
jgi:hypothetical protein